MAPACPVYVPRCPTIRVYENIGPFVRFQLLEMLKFYARFEISEETGDPLTDHDMTQLHYTKITSLQVRNERQTRSEIT